MIRIEPINESVVQIYTERQYLRELSEEFSFRAENYKFSPKFKMGVWDGYIRLINSKNATAPKGLIPEILAWGMEQNYRISVDPEIIIPFKEKIDFSWSDLNLPKKYEIRDYQQDAVDRCLRKKRQIILSATGSGKSLIIYALIRALQDALEPSQKILLIVPYLSLVNQMCGDFQEYAGHDNWDAKNECHGIYSGQDKDSTSQVYVSTWQSLQRLPASYFEQFGAIIGDEVHTFEADVCTKLVKNCTNAFFRFGFSGTLKDAKVHELQLISSFGPIHRVSSAKELIEQKRLSELNIKSLILKHSDKDLEKIKEIVKNYSKDAAGKKPSNLLYADEIEYIVDHEKRKEFVVKLAASRKKNTLVMYKLVEKHGKPLYDALKAFCPDKQIVFVSGEVSATRREEIRKLTEENSNVIIVASYGTFSTGINIVNLHNIILAAPIKSKIKILQTIGRLLRKGEGKEFAELFDISDDLRGSKKRHNYTLKHFVERYEMYVQEGYTVEIKEINL